MAKFELILPDEIIKQTEKLNRDSDKIFGGMTRAGAKVVLNNVKQTAPHAGISSNTKLSKTYKTPSDGGINTKVYFSGYLPFKGNRKTFKRRGRKGGDVYTTTKGVPVAFLAQIYEYGRSTSPFPKKPFFRKAFNTAQIEKAMLKAQKELSRGIIDEWKNRRNICRF